ncbi:hypothetical protein HFN06_25860 [Rhizobium leguminosarum]|uniref:hypothetical protein n=1 Tax=Rhizobium TaxID=379 RepID=UPI0013EE8BAB|nr:MULTISPECIES: hypothetical protein [Rhizobium]MCA2434865.1 hypothetical protein [Rhizobium leguminosarum]
MATYRGMFSQDVITDEIQNTLARGASIEELLFIFEEPPHDQHDDLTHHLTKYLHSLR